MSPQVAKKAPSAGTAKLKSLKTPFANFWSEFRRYKFGVFGLACFCIFVALVIFEPLIIPFPEASTRWRDITYWEDNPISAAPAWTNLFARVDKTPQEVLRRPKVTTQEESGIVINDAVFEYDFKYSDPPADMAFHAKIQGDATFVMSMVRPDGKEIQVFQTSTSSSVPKDFRVSLGRSGTESIIEFARQFEGENGFDRFNRNTFAPMDTAFGKAQPGMLVDPVPLKGKYTFKLAGVVIGSGEISDMRLVVAGKVFGILGTDSSKRDVWSGVICGTKWALLIGLLTSLVSVLIGVLYGVTSAYFGGFIDSVMMRIYEVVSSMPLLPVFIVVGAIFKPSIWTMIIMMCLFFWTGSVRTVRSMGLQIKEETYVEAAHALNASNARIILRHMLPQLIPFSFASMALSVPSAILYEASVSLLGLGDATIVTWGQILHDAMQGSAVLQGLWWWVVPPGLFIALMGMTFAFIGFAMDTILNPKLRTR